VVAVSLVFLDKHSVSGGVRVGVETEMHHETLYKLIVREICV
jgi:hypothetical protein